MSDDLDAQNLAFYTLILLFSIASLGQKKVNIG